MGDKVIMIGEDCPGFKVPAEVGGEFEKPALENVEPALMYGNDVLFGKCWQ